MKFYFFLIIYLTLLLPVFAQNNPVWKDKNAKTELRINDLVSKLTLDEKIDMLAGYKDFYFHPVERLKIDSMIMADGPLGIASWGIHGRATAFPAAIMAAATWNRNLMQELGDAYGQEWRSRGIHYFLGPGVNIYRSSKSGRNFEYYGEDPYLTSQLIVPFIKAIQSRGVAATVKHFIGNEQEFDRHKTGSVIDERTLHEIYLPPFKAAVQDAGVYALMAAYNPINGIWSTQNDYTLSTILKKKWAFKGPVMSDWDCTYSTAGAANAGLDMEMGSYKHFRRDSIKAALLKKQLTESRLDDMVKRIFYPSMKLGFFDRPQQDKSIPLFNASANLTAKKVAEEGIVLLRNENQLLPLKQGIKTIAVIGENANPFLYTDRIHKSKNYVYGGGGSSKVHPWYAVSILDGIIKSADPGTKVFFDEGADPQNAATLAKSADVVILATGMNSFVEQEGQDRPFDLSPAQESLIQAVTTANPRTIVVINAGGGINMSRWNDKAGAIVHALYAGTEGGNALAEVIFGKVNPSGKLPFSIERDWKDSPAYGNYDENRASKTVNYKEGIFVGYRHFDKKGIKPLYPFGFGLSYTDFKYSDIRLSPLNKKNSEVRVSFTITNTGSMDGFETAELYVTDIQSSVDRPSKELKGFEKVWIPKGQSKEVSITLRSDAFSFYDVKKHDWKFEKGAFKISVGGSSDNLKLSDIITL
ncbi:beta-glucosidase [Desertivirga arenae]|uniref:beta-glucosidase n=1 Tax=Desertivirga arenae TaxID=2810309 RepID=UPI001A95B552|nr:glycoside hydrolase family 3 C-terminal domain-containing protein [Pedobacter sp. SYSU D00823]